MRLNINKTKSKQVMLRISEETHLIVLDLAEENGVNATEMYRALIDGALEEVRKQPARK